MVVSVRKVEAVMSFLSSILNLAKFLPIGSRLGLYQNGTEPSAVNSNVACVALVIDMLRWFDKRHHHLNVGCPS